MISNAKKKKHIFSLSVKYNKNGYLIYTYIFVYLRRLINKCLLYSKGYAELHYIHIILLLLTIARESYSLSVFITNNDIQVDKIITTRRIRRDIKIHKTKKQREEYESSSSSSKVVIVGVVVLVEAMTRRKQARGLEDEGD